MLIEKHTRSLHLKDLRLADQHATTFLSEMVGNSIRLNMEDFNCSFNGDRMHVSYDEVVGYVPKL